MLDLTFWSDEQLLGIRHFGQKCLLEVRRIRPSCRDEAFIREHQYPKTSASDEDVADVISTYLSQTPRTPFEFTDIAVVVRRSLDQEVADRAIRRALDRLHKHKYSAVKRLRGTDQYAHLEEGMEVIRPVPDHVTKMIELRLAGRTLQEIASSFELTRERVRQLLKQYGGPSSAAVRAEQSRLREEAESRKAEDAARRIREYVSQHGPSTTAAVAVSTGIEVAVIGRAWPAEIRHLRLSGAHPAARRWSDEQVLDALREAALYEFPLTTKGYAGLIAVGQIEGPSVPRVSQIYGSWSEACLRAGVEPGRAHREYNSRWTDADLLQIVSRYMADPDSPGSATQFDAWKNAHVPDGPSFQTLRNRLGSWNDIKIAAAESRD